MENHLGFVIFWLRTLNHRVAECESAVWKLVRIHKACGCWCTYRLLCECFLFCAISVFVSWSTSGAGVVFSLIHVRTNLLGTFLLFGSHQVLGKCCDANLGFIIFWLRTVNHLVAECESAVWKLCRILGFTKPVVVGAH